MGHLSDLEYGMMDIATHLYATCPHACVLATATAGCR